MANLLEHRDDGSIALFINGDLQFDSRDEHIYHESLTLPALSIAAQRNQAPLKVLIIGGGDGLIARELFKSPSISSVDLVDYDPEIVSFAKIDFASFNNNSMSDPRLTIHVEDAWEFVNRAIEQDSTYDIIIGDLTVAEDISDARFHSIDWYNKLSCLLSADGILAVNAVSPLATPEAYWSIFNSILKGGLQPRPYHVHIPSFASRGYGQTWGRFIASAKSITINELGENIIKLKELFVFPQEIIEYQSSSIPALAGSDILLHYFANASACNITSGLTCNSFSLDIKSLVIPEPDTGKKILPPELRAALAKSISLGQESENINDPQILLQAVLQLMPSLQKEHTPQIIADFLEDPGHFLEAIDLPDLVRRLLQRAMELPAQVVAELELLREKLNEWAGDHLTLLSLGRRVVTILTLVIVVGNLLYPDSVYGKGEAGHHPTAGHHERAAAGRGRVGDAYYGSGTTYWNNYNRRPYNTTTTKTIRQPAPVPAQPGFYRTGTKQPGTMRQKLPNATGMVTPENPNAMLASYLSNVVREAQATRDRLSKNQTDFISYREILKRELVEYEAADKNMVSYGSHTLPKAEAIRRTQLALKRTLSKIDLLAKDIEQIPVHVELAKIALANLDQGVDKESGGENA